MTSCLRGSQAVGRPVGQEQPLPLPTPNVSRFSLASTPSLVNIQGQDQLAARPSERQGRCLLPVAPPPATLTTRERPPPDPLDTAFPLSPLNSLLPPHRAPPGAAPCPIARSPSPAVVPTEAEGPVHQQMPSPREGHPLPSEAHSPYLNVDLRWEPNTCPTSQAASCRARWSSPARRAVTSHGWKRRTMRPIAMLISGPSAACLPPRTPLE